MQKILGVIKQNFFNIIRFYTILKVRALISKGLAQNLPFKPGFWGQISDFRYINKPANILKVIGKSKLDKSYKYFDQTTSSVQPSNQTDQFLITDRS